MARACSRGQGPEAGGQVRLLILVVCVLGAFCGERLVAQNERARADALARRATERIRALHAEAEQLATQERTILNELRRLEVDRQIKAEEVARFDAELLTVQSELAATGARAAALERRVVEDAPIIAARLSSLYRMGRPGYWRLLLDVEDVRSVGRAYRTVSAMARLDRERVDNHRRQLAELRAARVALQRRAETARRVQAGASAARAALDRAIHARNARVESIDRQRDLNAQLAGELQDAQRKLQAAIAALAAGLPAGGTIALPIEPFRGDLPWPARGRVRAAFGRRRASRFGTSIIRNGVEIDAAEGAAVGAIHEGTVAFAGPFPGFGNLVILQHSSDAGREDFSLYGHLETMAVRKGDGVERQRQVGTVGRTPTGAAALYFELRIDGRPVDPLQWLKR